MVTSEFKYVYIVVLLFTVLLLKYFTFKKNNWAFDKALGIKIYIFSKVIKYISLNKYTDKKYILVFQIKYK